MHFDELLSTSLKASILPFESLPGGSKERDETNVLMEHPFAFARLIHLPQLHGKLVTALFQAALEAEAC